MEITAAQVKALRDATGAGMMDCRNALREAGGDLDKATQLLREAGFPDGVPAPESLPSSAAYLATRTGVDVDMDALPFDDPKVYELLRQARTAGVFQFESPLATDVLRQMRCDRFDDLVASNALLRPGPLDSGMHLVYIRRKRGEEPEPAAT